MNAIPYTLSVDAQQIPPESTPELTWKQQRFCEEVVKHNGNQSQAAIAAGYSPVAANVTGSQLVANPIIRSRIQQIADEVGLSAKRCLTVVADGLDAKRGLVVGGKENSRVEYVDDWQAKTKCAELGLKVHKAIDAHDPASVTVNVISGDKWDDFASAYFAKKGAIEGEKA